MGTPKLMVDEKRLRSYIRRQLLREARLLTELKDYARSEFVDYTPNDYFVVYVEESADTIMTIPFDAAGDLTRLKSISNLYPGAYFRDYELNPDSLAKIEKMVAAGLGHKNPDPPEPIRYPDITFDHRKGEKGSPAASWQSPEDVPSTHTGYKIYGPAQNFGIRVNHGKGEISMDLSFLSWMNRRGGQKPGSSPHRQYPSYVIPSGDVTAGTTQDIKKLLKHVMQRDARDILDYPIVGNEKFYGMTVRDVLGQRGASEIQRATDPSSTDLVAYHGTSSNLVKSILSKGLRPGKSQYSYVDQVAGWSDGNVYLTISPVEAENYATRAAIWYGGKPTVLRITVPDTTKIVADEDWWGKFELDEPVTVGDDDKKAEHTHIYPKHWPDIRKLWLVRGWIDERAAASIDAQVDRAIKTNFKRGMKGSGAFAYRGLIMPKFIEKWREYPKKSYGSENTLDQEKYDRIRREVQAQMKRFDQRGSHERGGD